MRTPLRALAPLLGGLGAVLGAAPGCDPAPEPLPSFIVVLADDQGWGTSSVLQDPALPESRSDFLRTPSLERLAAAGMRFAQAYAPHPNCSPSRAALLTGRSPAALHLTDIIERQGGPAYRGNRLVPPRHITALPAAERTLPELLKEAHPAYRAAHFGKWHLAGGGPGAHGFDAGDGATGNRDGNLAENLPDDPKQAFGITRRAIRWMEAQARAGHPFYLQVSHYAPHKVIQYRSESLARFREATPGTRHDQAEFAAMLWDLDAAVGELLDAVERLGLAGRTYVVFTSDNGTPPTADPGNVNGPVRGHKTTLWEGGVRVPFIVAGPGIEPGAVSRTPVIGTDLLPTILDLAGAGPVPELVEGGSLRAVLESGGRGTVQRRFAGLAFHWPHYQHDPRRRSVPDSTWLEDGWKLHYWWETGQPSLYHLAEDLDESEPLEARHLERVHALRTRLMSYLASVGAPRPRPNPRFDPARDPAAWRRDGDGEHPQFGSRSR